jgi:hypothetical protein
VIALDLRDEAARAPLDIGDASALTAAERAAALGNWRDRMVSEHASARVFAGFFDRLLRAGMPRRYHDMAGGAIDEELSHAVLCARALTALGGEARAPLPDPLPRLAQHEDATPVEAVLRDAISIGACSETVAVALVGAEREQAASPALREVLDRILADEVGHARLGWKLLDDLLPNEGMPTRRRLSAYLVAVFEHQIAFHAPFLDLPSMSDRGVGFGAPDGPSNWRVFVSTMSTVTIPGLEQRGLFARAAWDLAMQRIGADRAGAEPPPPGRALPPRAAAPATEPCGLPCRAAPAQ